MKVYILLGTGGVGKTSIAAGLAARMALKNKKTLVITIDPSQRLKTTLNIQNQSGNQSIQSDVFQDYLYASLLQSKQIFDDFIRRGLKNEVLAQKLLNNKLYQQLSTTLNGSQEFTALEKLLLEVESKNWDVIILDTPPAGHAIDFLRAPQKLNRLLDDRISKWFRSPANGGSLIGSLLQFGTKNLLKALEMLTGSEFMHELSDFFSQIQLWQNQLSSRLGKVQMLLKDPMTQFLLVTGYDHAKIKESLFLLKTVRQEGYNLNQIIINRARPYWAIKNPNHSKFEWDQKVHSYFEERALKSYQLLTQVNQELKLYELPDFKGGVQNIADLLKVSENLNLTEAD